MRALILASVAGLAACGQAPPATLPSGTPISCENLESDRSMADGMRVIADSVINTTDPAEIERLQKLKDDARAALEQIQARIDACEAAP